ncbi:hypothetical protein JCM9140_1494 [Halalkalibacter wakoensis JCM 9140]|uniref:Uncharacterized protein n=1 Tax=Halalkalibacter wakoensis JCM 9140 TaxID=1236970 RepID=W4Q0A4_9BACI|nr:hypothetical protein [Halalkalibacter wakoensis]GAE25496.1 hypothetical protein JCM9140_1494 [Halalkalibacter wakoensis JCM 9140]
MSKYRYAEYWKAKAKSGEQWLSPATQIYKQNDLIFVGQILNIHSGQQESLRLLFPDIKAVAGFLQYIFLPTAFIGYFMIDEMDPKTIMLGDGAFSNLLDQLPLREQFDMTTKETMQEILDTIEATWIIEEQAAFLEIEKALRLLESINVEHVITSFNILRSPSGLATWLVSEYENQPILGINSLEEEVNMKVQDFIQLSKEAEYQLFNQSGFSIH